MRRLSGEDDRREPWIVFTDIVLVSLFMFIIFVFAQYIKYEKVAVVEELERRKHEMISLIRDSVPRQYQVAIDTGEGFSQRITFSSDLLFATCQDRLRAEGRDVVLRVGRLLGPRLDYFQSIEVEGHTDPRPPTGEEACPFEDNWELSSRRAATVVRILASQDLLATNRLSAVGRAQFQPPLSITRPLPARPDGAKEEYWEAYRRIEMVLEHSEENIEDSLGLATAESVTDRGQRR